MQKKSQNGLAMALIVLGVAAIYVMQWGPSPLLMTIRDHFGLTDDQFLNFARQFYDNLPACYRLFIQAPTAA